MNELMAPAEMQVQASSSPDEDREKTGLQPAAERTTPTIRVRVGRLPSLDGWRGVSILLVLAGHMIPLSPKWLNFNAMAAAAGLSIFFVLSGFLVVSMLIENESLYAFFVRRFFRIVPLAWLVVLAMLLVEQPASDVWLANFFFYANFSEATLLEHGKQLWSLSVEVQFYVWIGVVVALFGRRGLFLIPVACVAVTIARVAYGMEFSILTWFRVDEILAGGSLALFIHYSKFADTSLRWPRFAPYVLMLLLLATCFHMFGALLYLRPYAAALLVYSTIKRRDDWLQNVLTGRVLRYFAKTSYAVYVIHPVTHAGWLGEGDVVVRYAKRILSFILTFLFAHISTNYYEKYWIALSHRLSSNVAGSQSKQSSLQLQSVLEK